MLIEIISQLLSGRWYKTLSGMMTEQIVFDIFNQNLTVIQNFIMAVAQQQDHQIAPGTRPLKNDQHLISISLQLCQKMMFQHPKLMQVLSHFPNIETLFQTVFLKLETERIQQKFSQTFLEICKKLDTDLPKAMIEESQSAG